MVAICLYCKNVVTGNKHHKPYHASCYAKERERLPKINRKLKQIEKLVAEIKSLVR